MGIFINCTANFKSLNRTLFVGGELDGRATVRFRETDTGKVLEELCHADATDVIRLHKKVFNVLAEAEAAQDRLEGE